jgi:NapC/NirT cytochrome c family protein
MIPPARLGRRQWLSPLVHLSNNVLSFLGVLLTTTGGVAWLFILPQELRGGAEHPYLGILFFLVCPSLFFTGLALIPLGIWLRFRGEKARGELPDEFPPVDWRNADFRRLTTFVALATFANVVIGGNFTYAAVSYMDSVSFCGQACHTVMQPEFGAYQDSPHFRVSCTGCHIGEGASWFVRSKLSGVRQLFAVAFNTYSRPIPTPVHNLRPARETCEACHWPRKFSGYRLRIIPKFAEDEANTPSKTVLLMKVGGSGGDVKGIHGFHLGPGVQVEYASDPSRQNISWVRYTDGAGQATEYAADGFKSETLGRLERRVMDCMDCHNRPTHAFDLPEPAVDRALAEGRIPASLPMIRKQGVEVLKASYASAADAGQRLPAALDEFYAKQYPAVREKRADDIRQAAAALVAIFRRNVFPEMKVTWGSYPNNVGHTYFPGCFRCHDDGHKSAAGKAISQDCSACHQMLAMEDPHPEILKQLSIE